jgi:hypothetical protein
VRFVTTFGLVGMGGGFLLISPSLRESLWSAVGRGQQVMQTYQPFSYVVAGVLGIVALGAYMYRCSQPH